MSKKLQKINTKNLLFISEELINFDPFIFYGTLLGITRENNIIKNDDDIDFLIDQKFKKKIMEKINTFRDFIINKKVSNNYFIQLVKIEDDVKTFVDIYFYINEASKDFIIEKHNFLSSTNIEEHAIHIPKELIFPLKKSEQFLNVNLPNKQKETCNYLYGSSWVKPIKKNSGYRMEIINNKPKLIKRSFLGSITRNVKEFFLKKFKKN